MYPRLEWLFRAAFPPDWDLDGDDWLDALRAALQFQPAIVLLAAADEAERLLTEHPEDAALAAAVFGRLGCRFDPRRDDPPTDLRPWLRQVAALLRHEAGSV